MTIFGIHVCMDEIRAFWPVALFVLPTVALTKSIVQSWCRKHRNCGGK